MSYNQKPPGPSGSGMGGGPPNGPNNIPQVAKTFAGIQQQMQNLVHGQNAIPQSSQADINAFLQQQRIQNMLKQQQQFLQFQHQMQQQQQHQQQQHHNMAGGGGVGPVPVGSVPGVGGVPGPAGGGPGGSGEPLALTRTAGAADLLNKTYQQQANGNPATNPTFNQLQQTLQALPTNFVQQLQVFQYQMQAKQMQQQHSGGQGQHGHGQQQPVQGVPPPPPTTTPITHQQQQQQQKHQNQHQQQQQQNALSRYLTAAAAQAAAVSGNKISSGTPPPPPLTNQMKPPTLPPNTQITPVTTSNIIGGNLSAVPHPKMSAGNASGGSSKHPAPPPSISLTPSKPAISGPSVAHQQNKFTPPSNSGAGKGSHLGHSQNLPKSTHGSTTTHHTVTTSSVSPSKSGTITDATVAALKSPQSTPVQLTKPQPPTATTAATGNKTALSATTTTTGPTSTMVSPHKTTIGTSALTPTVTNTLNTTLAFDLVAATSTTAAAAAYANAVLTKPSGVSKPAADEIAASKLPLKTVNAAKESIKTPLNEGNKSATDSSATSNSDSNKKEAEKIKEKRPETTSVASIVNKPIVAEIRNPQDKSSNDLKTNAAQTPLPAVITAPTTPVEEKATVAKNETSTKSNKAEKNDAIESGKNLPDVKKAEEKNISSTAKEKTLTTPAAQDVVTKLDAAPSNEDNTKTPVVDLNQLKKSDDEKKSNAKDEILDKEKDKKLKASRILSKPEEAESVKSKDVQIAETESDKLNTIVEIKKTLTTLQATNYVKPTQNKEEAKVKNFSEENNKKEKIEETIPTKIEEKQQTAAAIVEKSSTRTRTDSTAETENKKAAAPKQIEEPKKSIKSTDVAETATVAKTTSPAEATIIKELEKDSVSDTPENAEQNENKATTATTTKKVARHPKGARTKTATPAAPSAAATPAESKILEEQEDKSVATTSRVKRKLKSENSVVLESASLTPKDDDSDRKSKRHRLKTILYQSPLPELAFITKLSASEASNSPKPMANEDRLIVFYKNEYMAVRNAEGTFYLCQTMQNVYRTSPRISIRWLSEDAKDINVFIPDFYDHTDIECVLTTVELKRIDKGHLRLPEGERSRIENILKKAIDVENGLVPRPELTEENPDGLDISLFKDESQIEKKSASMEGSESQTPSMAASRKSKRANTASASSIATPSASAGNKRKSGGSSATLASSSASRKVPAKKRKILLKRKKKLDHSDDDDETSDDPQSDVEYKPTQKRSSLTGSNGSKSAPRAQRSPLAKARAASPITPTTSRSKSVPQKTIPTPSTSKASRGERAAKRKSLTDSYEEVVMPVRKPTITSNNKSKGTLKKTKH